MLGAMTGLRAPPASPGGLISGVGFGLVIAGYLACLILPNVNEMFRDNNVGLDTYRLPRPWSVTRLHWRMDVPWAIAAAALLMTALVAILAAGEGTPFLYFQF